VNEWLWILIAAGAALAATLYTFLDNYSIDVFFKGRTPQAQNMFIGPAYILAGIILMFVLPIHTVTPLNAAGIIGSGILASIACVFYYKALGAEDSTRVTLLQQLSPIFYLIFGIILLGEEMSQGKMLGLVVILMVPIVIFMRSKKNSQKTQMRTFTLISVKNVISALANVLIVMFGVGGDPFAVVAFAVLGKGIGDTGMMLLNKKWRERWKTVYKKNGSKLLGVLSIDCLVWLANDFVYYAAITMAPTVAIGSAVVKGLQPAFVFIMGVVLTLIWPNFGREKIDRRTISTNLIVTIIAVVGIVLMQLL
jgi:drug/metabolite transporter (DMT)-like permease